jgi:P4 family phage/plasmid primase-like protien
MLARAVLDEGPLAWGTDGGFWSYADGVWVPTHKEARRRVAMLLGNLFRTGHASNTSEYLEHAVPKISAEPLRDIINFRNGILDWRTLEMSEHSPEILSTIQMGTTWDPAATCPQFDTFIEEVLHPDYHEMVWEMIGYLMFSGNPLQVAFLLYGSGGYGKGTLIRVIEELLGRRNVANESLDDLNNGRFNVANLFGKIANIAGDIDATYQETTAMFKKLTGEDSVSAEKKYRDAFSFQNWAVPIFSANKIPGSADVTEGYLRRWVVLHFHRRFSGDERDNSLSDRFLTELPGIAAKAVPALQRLMERGRFEFKGIAATGREEFAEALDQVRQWVADATVPAPDHFVPRAQAYVDYQAWAKVNGIGVLRSPEFYHRLEALGLEKVKRNGTHGFKGIFTSPTKIASAQSSLEPERDPIEEFWRGVT